MSVAEKKRLVLVNPGALVSGLTTMIKPINVKKRSIDLTNQQTHLPSS